MIAAFSGFLAGSFVGLQEFGLGLSAAMLLDATLVRAILVPATMKLLGRWNWYLPDPVRRALRLGPPATERIGDPDKVTARHRSALVWLLHSHPVRCWVGGQGLEGLKARRPCRRGRRAASRTARAPDARRARCRRRRARGRRAPLRAGRRAGGARGARARSGRARGSPPPRRRRGRARARGSGRAARPARRARAARRGRRPRAARTAPRCARREHERADPAVRRRKPRSWTSTGPRRLEDPGHLAAHAEHAPGRCGARVPGVQAARAAGRRGRVVAAQPAGGGHRAAPATARARAARRGARPP